jgi:hypothetical protein
MVTRKSRLETQFTGDDKPFQRTAARVSAAGAKVAAKMKAMTSGLQGGFAAIGGTMLVKSTLDKYDRIGKLSTRFGIASEELQRLGHLADLGGSDLESVAKAMQKLNLNATAAAVHGMKGMEQEFKLLGIDSKEFLALNHEQRFLAMGDAIRKSSNRNVAFAASQKLMGKAGQELFQIMEQSRESQMSQMDSVRTISQEQTRAIEGLNDHLHTLTTGAVAEFAKSLVFLWNKVKDLGDILGWLGAHVAAAFDPDLDFQDIQRATREIWEENKKLNEENKKADEERFKRQDQLDEDLFAKAKERAKKTVSQVGFDPSAMGGFFGHAGRSGISAQVKTMEQKQTELMQGVLNELRHSNRFMQKELG